VAEAKKRELAAHARAQHLHEEAAQLQDELGHEERAAAARDRAKHAGELHALALVEQAEIEDERTH